MKKWLGTIALVFFTAAAFAADFGLVLGAEGEYAGGLPPEGFSAAGTAIPWVSAVFNEKINLYVSAKLTVQYEEKQDPLERFLFEAERIELNVNPLSPVHITLGRQRFQDSAGMIAQGLFDGLDTAVNLDRGRLSLGAFYTGLLYKKTAKILLTGSDLERYQKPLDSPNLEGYFASRRILLSLAGEFPGLLPGLSLTGQGLAQFDVNGAEDALHAQYLEARLTLNPLDPLYADLGAVGEFVQVPDDKWGSMAVFAGTDWEVPGLLNDLLSAKFFWTSGKTGGVLRAYTPVGGVSGGRIFTPGLGALMNAGLSYQARFLAGFSGEAGMAYYIRTDTETLGDGDLDGSSTSPFLGGELYGSLVWVPDPALRFTAGGGAFFPRWGGAFRGDAPVRWKVNFGVIISL
jgi:hypothetical protein